MNDRHAQHLQPLNPLAVRLACREERLSSHTNGLAPGHVQGNLVLLPKAYAFDFLLFCHRNPKPCPLLAVSEAGQWALPALGQDIDLRSDLPRYRVWESGELIDEPTNISGYWREDLVGFVLGCSFSFEEALIEAGVSVKHLSCGLNVPMYRTSIATE
ncbi:MAG: D-glutamate cyclase family protein, partial [Burkholderiaceae bacterium]